MLAESLHKYSKYLEVQNKKVHTLQHDTVPARSISDSLSLFTLPVQDLRNSSVISMVLPIYNALKDKKYFQSLLINDLMPSPVRVSFKCSAKKVVANSILCWLHLELEITKETIISVVD